MSIEASTATAHERLKALFSHVCEVCDSATLDASDAKSIDSIHRALDSLNATDSEREAVLMLLKNDKASTVTATSSPSNPVNAMLNVLTTPQLKIGSTLGVWTIDDKIGQGGMGAVYRARRHDGQFQQTVAIKLLAGFATPSAITRLVEERKTLAALEHPNIARLIDGGSTSVGVPYIVMDYVDGLNIAAHCDEKKRTPQDVVALMITVCEAVSYAHQNLILHCDLKPANILVDVNRSRATDEHAMPAYTPRYASPEQRSDATLTTATDIYSLGILLAELIDAAQMHAANARQFVKEAHAIATRASANNIAARYRSVTEMRADLVRLQSHLPVAAMRGGVWYVGQKLLIRRWPAVIALSALVVGAAVFTARLVSERDRALRAETQAASELNRALAAEDLARAERDRAQVSELRATAREKDAQIARAEAIEGQDRAKRAEQLSRAETMRALRAEAQTQIEATNTRETRDFLLSLFDGADPNLGGSPTLTAQDLLTRGRARIAKLPTEQKELRANLQMSLGRIHENIGLLAEAKAIYRELAESQKLLIPQQQAESRYADALNRIAIIEQNSGNASLGEAPAREVLKIREQLPVVDARAHALALADAQNTLGLVLTGMNRYAEAATLLNASLVARERYSGVPSEDVASTFHNIAQNFSRGGKLIEAEKAYRRSLDMKAQLFGQRHPKMLNSLVGLGAVYSNMRRFREAEPLLMEAWRIRVDVHGEKSELVAAASNELGSLLHDMGRYAEAKARYLEAIKNPVRSPDSQGRRSTSYAVSVNNLATLYEETGDLAEAEARYRESIAVRRLWLPEDDLSVVRVQFNLGRLLIKIGNLAEANTLITRAYDIRLKKLGAAHMLTNDSLVSLVECVTQMGDLTRATQLFAKVNPAISAERTLALIALKRTEALLKERTLVQENTKMPSDVLALWQTRSQIAERELGAQHLITLRAKLDYAQALSRAARGTEAQSLAAAIAPTMTAALASDAGERRVLAALLAPPIAAR
jgi:eukaryotic-like serine/threonine-protein kinase